MFSLKVMEVRMITVIIVAEASTGAIRAIDAQAGRNVTTLAGGHHAPIEASDASVGGPRRPEHG